MLGMVGLDDVVKAGGLAARESLAPNLERAVRAAVRELLEELARGAVSVRRSVVQLNLLRAPLLEQVVETPVLDPAAERPATHHPRLDLDDGRLHAAEQGGNFAEGAELVSVRDEQRDRAAPVERVAELGLAQPAAVEVELVGLINQLERPRLARGVNGAEAHLRLHLREKVFEGARGRARRLAAEVGGAAQTLGAYGVLFEDRLLAEEVAQLPQQLIHALVVVLREEQALHLRVERLHFGEFERAVVNEHDRVRADVPRAQNPAD